MLLQLTVFAVTLVESLEEMPGLVKLVSKMSKRLRYSGLVFVDERGEYLMIARDTVELFEERGLAYAALPGDIQDQEGGTGSG